MICQRIIDEGIQLPFFVETRADNCDKELIQLMKEAGVQEVNFGLESASRTVLQAVKKAPGREKEFLDTIKKCVHWAKETGIATSVSTIFGLPREGLKEAKETLDFVKELNVDEYYHNVLFLCAGTELFGSRKQYGLDVVHSPSVLPYITVYAYNVEKVDLLPHASLHGQIRTWKKMYCDLLSYGSRDQHYKHLLIKKMPDSVEQLCSWLQEYCVVHLSVYDFTKNTGKEVAAIREAFFDKGVPLGVYTVVNEESQCLNQYSQIDVSTPVPVVPFHRYRIEGALYTLKQPQDVKMLAEFFAAHVREGILSFNPEEIPQTLVDACKWGESLCPALSRGVLVVDGDTVLSCCNGGGIGRIGDNVQTLRENIQDMLREKEKERGCDSCPVKNECSHCLFPRFDGRFCELKRRYPGISALITILEWLYRYAGDSHAVVQFRVDEKASPLFYTGTLSTGDAPSVRDTVRVVSLDGNAFAFTADELQGFSLEPELAAILEAFQLNVDKEEVISYLCETGADRENAVEAVSRAEFIFEVAGLVKGAKS
jgi:MoaA/NifB/PqqE/SkfB family radical SAM enzyme